MCHAARSRQQFAAPQPRAVVRPADPGARVGDAERDTTASLLADATAEGYLTLAEHEERLATALSARTSGELSALIADLPPAWRAERERRAAAQALRRTARATLRPHLAAYVLGMTLMVAIWLVVGVTAGAWYPWPIWPALGWGIGVVSHARGAYGRQPERPATPVSA